MQLKNALKHKNGNATLLNEKLLFEMRINGRHRNRI